MTLFQEKCLTYSAKQSRIPHKISDFLCFSIVSVHHSEMELDYYVQVASNKEILGKSQS